MSDSEVKWGDDIEDKGDIDQDSVDKVEEVTQPDGTILKTVVRVITDEKGQRVKVTRKTRGVKKIVRVNKNVMRRRKLAKFGDCTGQAPGPEQTITYQVVDAVKFDIKPLKTKEDLEKADPFANIKTGDSIVVCRHCGETGHWTLKCPLRGKIVAKTSSGKEIPADATPMAAIEERKSLGGKYVPPSQRAGYTRVGGQPGRDYSRDDATTLRVTNLSEDTTEQDLSDLFCRFGRTTRVFLAKDRVTGLSRGFAFISYSTRDEAQAAIDKLDGFGYDNLILHVEWAKPRENRTEAERTQQILQSQRRRF